MSLRYPIILVHGLGWRDDTRWYRYWGKVPALLEGRGALVFLSGHDAMSSVAVCGAQIRARVAEVLALTGATKVNLIAHSKGGLDAREALRDSVCASAVASLITISSPHHGSRIAERLWGKPRWFLRALAGVFDFYFRLRGDALVDAMGACESLLPDACEAANERDLSLFSDSGIVFRSYATMHRPKRFWDLFFLSGRWLSRLEGANDGVVSVDSARWLGFRGVIEGAAGKGAAHDVMIGRRGLSYPVFLSGSSLGSVADFYELLLDWMVAAGL